LLCLKIGNYIPVDPEINKNENYISSDLRLPKMT